MNSRRLTQLLSLLQMKQGYISSEELAAKLMVSSRTIRNDLAEINTFLPEDIQIEILPGKGVRLKKEHIQAVESLILKLANEADSNMEHRIDQILYRLLMNETYIRIEDLSEQMYVAEPIIKICLKKVREILKEHQLILKTRTHYGMRVYGDEYDIRICLLSHVKDLPLQLKRERAWIGYEAFREKMKVFMHDKVYPISDENLDVFCEYLYIAFLRSEKNPIKECISRYPMEIELLKEFQEMAVPPDLFLPASEVQQASCYLAAIRIYTKEECRLSAPAYLNDLISDFLARIKESFRVDLHKDMELRTNLLIHMYSFDLRIRYGAVIHNPLLTEIRTKYAFAYDCASVAMDYISRYYKKRIRADETGFLAILLYLSMERMKTSRSRKNILLICSSGRGTAKLLQYEIKNRFSKNVRSITVMSLQEVENTDVTDWDMILTTVQVTEDFPIPILRINNFLDSNDIQRIEAALEQTDTDFLIQEYFPPELFFTAVSFTSKEEAIKALVERIAHARKLPEQFLEYVMRREQNEKTSFGNYFAMPHPYLPITEDTFISVTVLSKPMSWDTHRIRMIVLLSTSRYYEPRIEQIYALLSQLLLNPLLINRIIKGQSYEVFLETMEELKGEYDG